MSATGGYTLHLYCDNEQNHCNGYLSPASHVDLRKFPMEFVADGNRCYTLTRKLARKQGWIFHKDGRITCPICNKRPPHHSK